MMAILPYFEAPFRGWARHHHEIVKESLKSSYEKWESLTRILLNFLLENHLLTLPSETFDQSPLVDLKHSEFLLVATSFVHRVHRSPEGIKETEILFMTFIVIQFLPQHLASYLVKFRINFLTINHSNNNNNNLNSKAKKWL